MGSHKNSSSKGFTIIEVLIVLAIAGLILLIIFLMVPSLQRNARNHSRKNAVLRVVGELNTYYAVYGRYPLWGSGASEDDRTAFVNALTAPGGSGGGFAIHYTDNDGSHEYPFSGGDSPASPEEAFDEISIEPGHWCNRSGAGPGDVDFPLISSINGDNDYRQFAVWTQLENVPMLCVDSRG